MPGEVLWPTAAFGALIVLVFGGLVLLRLLPHKSRVLEQPERDALEDLQGRLGQLDQLQERMSELEERVDFTERLLTKQREADRLDSPPS